MALSEDSDKLVAPPKVLELRYWDDRVLSQICEKVSDTEFDASLAEFGRELIATMEANHGIGLAAPQVGVTKRIFAMRFPDNEDLTPVVVVNPTLDLRGRTSAEQEGCLSVPGVFQQVYRAGEVIMQYQDVNGKFMEMLLITPFDARVAQHEFDHLNGIMFFDYKDKRPEYGARMSKQMSKQVLREWEKERRRRGI